MLCAMSIIAKSLLAFIAFFFLASIGLIAFYRASGQYVDENGVLVEEFWALGLGTLSLLVAAALGLVFALKVTLERRGTRPHH